MTMSVEPRPAPNRYSPQPAAFASFSMTTGRRSWSSSRARSGASRQAMFGAKRTVARAASTKAAQAMELTGRSSMGQAVLTEPG